VKKIAACLSVFLILASPEAFSRDTKHMLPIQEAMQSPEFKEKLDPSIRFYFGNQKHPKVSSYGDFWCTGR
jgi:hypothetical protein